ncbi:hypothetical protein [Microlunatus sp. GCM10028923]|uniref:hypothetical protein n=1 Tax=Microlunatus sp. GCM10028923 TaxID=3273400 RepID=UPI0036230113
MKNSPLRRRLARVAGWGATFLGYPVGGALVAGLIGPVDGPGRAVVGGAVVGLLVGAAQALAVRDRLPLLRWPLATMIGTATGLVLGSAAIGYRTSIAELVGQGAITGAVLGVAQALALPAPVRVRAVWVGASAVIMAAGWLVTSAIGVDVERQYATFGAAGALLATAGHGLLLFGLVRREPGR